MDELSNSSHCLKPPTADQSNEIAPLDMTAFYGSFIFLLAGKHLFIHTQWIANILFGKYLALNYIIWNEVFIKAFAFDRLL